ncbi:putative trans-sialidase, Group V [Trypanosoma cruzi]|nr:putative trans-sialidase, Group V [Trypanosoma cruzi]
MLSRVAAVMAPRTHNRRRVTGSSRRRREGRESEPQRSNMSRHHFYSALLLLVVVMMCCGSGAASSKDMPSASGSSKEERYVWRDVKEGEKLSLFRVPSLVEMDGEVFAVAEAQCTKDENSFTGIASELLKLTDENQKELVITQMKTQVLEECSSEEENCASQEAAQAGFQSKTPAFVGKPTTVVEESDIYMLVGKYSREDAARCQGGADAAPWGLLLVRGHVSGTEGGKNIHWKDTHAIPCTFLSQQHESLTRLIGGGGSGVHTGEGTLLFPVEATKKEKEGKTVSLILYSKDTKSWKLSNWMSADGCSVPSVVEWKDKKLMMMTACDDGRRRVYESDDKGDSWTEALGTLSRVWGNKKGVRSGFITAKIEERDVMLVTLPVYLKGTEKGQDDEKGELHLWLTDNTHIADIGPVSGDYDVAASSLLYKSGDNNELIALYEKKKGDEEESLGMVSVRLTAQLEKVKDVLTTWNDVDDRVSQLCTTLLALKDPSTDTACTDKITDGLVGFLSGNFSENTWRDEYLGVNATVKNGATEASEPSDGVTFHGAWAEWPVGAQGENQLYHFANYNFTLVATVSIDKVPEGDTPIPLMGVQMKGAGNSVFLGLSYNNKEKKWMLQCGGGTKSEGLSSTGEPETKRHVVILLRNGNQSSAYVDGQRVGNEQCALGSMESQEISHFYIGGDGGSAANRENREDVFLTVTNVLLYNRPLSDNEIGVLYPNKVAIQQLRDKSSEPSPVSSDSVDTNTSPVTAVAQQTETLSTPDGKHLTEQRQSMGSSNAGSGGASTTAVSAVSTPAAGEESVMQVAPGSSSGHKNVGGGSSSDGDPTLETREGGTNGQEEEANTQVRELNATALSSNLGNVSQESNSDAVTVCGSGLLPSLLLLLLGLWGFAAL